MNAETEILSLHAETLALSWIVAQVFGHLARSDPKLAEAISRGFSDAASGVENLAISAGKAVPSEHLVKAMGIIEELRTAALSDHDKPRHVV